MIDQLSETLKEQIKSLGIDITLPVYTIMEYLDMKLKEWAYQYYTLDKPVVTDTVYDMHFQLLDILEIAYPDLATKDSVTKRIGSTTLDTLKKVKHQVPMLSLRTETDYSDQGALEFDRRVKEGLGISPSTPVVYVAEPKFDGLAISLRYEFGQLVLASTRGDGEEGEDVTHNVRMIRDIPHALKAPYPELVEIRGEVLMTKFVFEMLNTTQKLLGKKLYANPRNAAAGSIRQLSSIDSAKRNLSFFAYGIGLISVDPEFGDRDVESQQEALTQIRNWGFPVSKEVQVFSHKQGLIDYHKAIAEKRDSLAYEIDGVVYKVNNFALQKRLGYTGREPVWAVAHKFPAELAVTKLLGIDLQVGRTGKLTPVARLEPVKVGGVVVSNATLHNVFEIRAKKIRVGDLVSVRRAGDVVPEVVESVHRETGQYVKNFTVGGFCPVCDGRVERAKGEMNYHCVNSTGCSAQLVTAITHFAHRRAVFINGMGDKIAEDLVEYGLVKTLPDLFKISVTDLVNTIPRMAEKSAKNLVESIQQAKKTTLARLIFGLGIRHVGESTAKDLARRFGTIENIIGATRQDFLSVPDVGEVIADSLVRHFSKASSRQAIEELVKFGVCWESAEPTSQALAGKVFCITGTLEGLSRDDVINLVESSGGKMTGSVSKKTDYLIVGNNPGSSLSKAQQLGVSILNKPQLLEILGLSPDGNKT